MAEFEVKVVAIDAIEEHPNADAIEIAVVGGYRSIVKKNTVASGDLVVYIPEASILPDWLLKDMGFWKEGSDKGTLAGKQGNRVKAVRLRGVVSQGIIYPLQKITHTDEPYWDLYFHTEGTLANGESHIRMPVKLGDPVDGRLGIIKYEPPIPTDMSGQVCNQIGLTPRFDIESIQKWPNIIEKDEEVVITEKLHGTWTCFGCVPSLDDDELFDGSAIITSKGLSGRGLAFKWVDENREKNLYTRVFEQIMLNETVDMVEEPNPAVPMNRWDILSLWAKQFGMPYYILGEIFGPGVQGDFNYGFQDKQFRVFDIYAGTPGQGQYLGYHDLMTCTVALRLPMVPLLSWGPFSTETAEQLRDGKPVEGGEHVREGIVIKPVYERRHEALGRVCLKYVSPDYLLRGGNATEYS